MTCPELVLTASIFFFVSDVGATFHGSSLHNSVDHFTFKRKRKKKKKIELASVMSLTWPFSFLFIISTRPIIFFFLCQICWLLYPCCYFIFGMPEIVVIFIRSEKPITELFSDWFVSLFFYSKFLGFFFNWILYWMRKYAIPCFLMHH